MPNSLIDFRDWSPTDLEKLFDLSFHIEKEKSVSSSGNHLLRTAALLFFEPSTRTRISFESACHREQISATVLSGKSGTSLEKGETLEDTVLNIAAMEPDVLIIRSGSELDLHQLRQKVSQPILNGGWGTHSHPTQALLDIRTLLKRGQKISDIRIVLVGDVKYSRVAHSHFELSRKLGYQVAVCGPREFLPSQSDVTVLEDIKSAMEWGNVLMMLRFQLERHQQTHRQNDWEKYQINLQKLKAWQEKGWLMHPGPINYGIEMDRDVESYPKNLIFEQVNSGLWIRRACLRTVLK